MANNINRRGWRWHGEQSTPYLSAYSANLEGVRITGSSTGCDVRLLGDTPASNYVLWDASNGNLGINTAITTSASELHCLDVTTTGTLSSGGGFVGGNFAVTTAGTAGSWVSGIYAKVTQGTTKNVNGYISGAEFEVVNTNTNVSDWFPLVLNANSTNNGSHSSFIALRNYGTQELNSFLWVSTDFTVGSADTSLVASKNAAAVSHTLRIIVGGTPYWIMLSNAR